MATATGVPVRLVAPELLKSWARNDVWRCRVDSPATTFLTDRSLAPPVAPRLLAGDADARIFVMEDLGAGRTLAQAPELRHRSHDSLAGSARASVVAPSGAAERGGRA